MRSKLALLLLATVFVLATSCGEDRQPASAPATLPYTQLAGTWIDGAGQSLQFFSEQYVIFTRRVSYGHFVGENWVTTASTVACTYQLAAKAEGVVSAHSINCAQAESDWSYTLSSSELKVCTAADARSCVIFHR